MPTGIAYYNTSANWSKYSFSTDVIIGKPACGIARLLVKQLPAIFPKDSKDQSLKQILFALEHDPMPQNYAHVQIMSAKDGIRTKKTSQVTEAAKKEFRQMMSDRLIVLMDAVPG